MTPEIEKALLSEEGYKTEDGDIYRIKFIVNFYQLQSWNEKWKEFSSAWMYEKSYTNVKWALKAMKKYVVKEN